MTYNMYVCIHIHMYNVYRVDYRGAAAPKNRWLHKTLQDKVFYWTAPEAEQTQLIK